MPGHQALQRCWRLLKQRNLGERLTNAPKEIAAFAKDISRLSNSFYLLAETISGPAAQQQYRTSERIKSLGASRSCIILDLLGGLKQGDILILNAHIDDARAGLKSLSRILHKRRVSRPVLYPFIWAKEQTKAVKLRRSLRETCDALLIDLNAINMCL